MRFTLRSALGAMSLAGMALVACSGDDGGGTATTAPPGGATTQAGGSTDTTGTVDLAGQTIEIAAVWSGDEQANFESVLAEFEESTGADVTFTSTGDDIAAVLGPRIQGGNPPDLAILPQPGLMADFASQGVLQPIEDVVGEAVDNDFGESWRTLGTVDDTLYGLWFKAANKSTVWYNVAQLQAAGVEEPQSWEELLVAAQTMSDFGLPAFSVAGADGWTLTDWFENVYLNTAGADAYDQLTNHEIPWTDETVVNALQELATIWVNPEMLAGGTTGALQTDFPTSVTKVFTDPPEAAMVYEGDFVAGVITGETDATLGDDARFFPFPAAEGEPRGVVAGGDVVVLFDANPASEALLQYLATADAAEIWAAEGGFTSPNRQVSEDVYPDDISRAGAAALTEADVLRFDMSDQQPAAFGGTPGQGEWKILQDFLADPTDPAGTAQQLEAAAAAAYGGS
ncbi:MAG: ABC transporter substrate-binding protein [Acidimicrobiia bacterium]